MDQGDLLQSRVPYGERVSSLILVPCDQTGLIKEESLAGSQEGRISVPVMEEVATDRVIRPDEVTAF